ncbi:MAG: hypothetical protein P8166_18250, partial [Candidatus Thiodiazotropha sp.]
YETACRLADDQSPNKEAIRKLVAVIMRAVRNGAGNDSLAQQELEQEELARATHYELLEQPLVADLLDPDTLIGEEELLPVLLSAERDAFEAALTLFDPSQLSQLSKQGERLLQSLQEGEALQACRQRVEQIKRLAEA